MIYLSGREIEFNEKYKMESKLSIRGCDASMKGQIM